jgi:5-oxoprolinase (ATP-hydrolysing) subunit C
VQTTVQDLGRQGSRHLGVGSCGAMDRLALMIGNELVGNAGDAAGLELCLPPASIRFDAPHAVALSGADCPARLDGTPLSIGRCVQAEAGMTLDLAAATSGARAYLCIAGGIDVPLVMGSRSTDLQARMGGLEGRLIRRGDVLGVLPPGRLRPPLAAALLPTTDGRIRVMAGPEFADFEPEARDAFFNSTWKVTPQSNRMGYRLEGPALLRRAGDEPRSHAVFPGIIQVPPGGAPIVLMADAHATGGYPRFATVIAADQWRLAQLAPGAPLQFALCTRAAAIRAWQEQQVYLQGLRGGRHGH